MKKRLALGKKYILPHIKEIGKSVPIDALEGRNIGQLIKSNSKQAALNSLTGRRRTRHMYHH